MALTPFLVSLRWTPVVGATGYEILIDGKKIATAGAAAKSTRVSVGDGVKVVEVIDLPHRSSIQSLSIDSEEV